MPKHLSDEDLIRLHLRIDDERVSREAREHLEAGCVRCRRRLEQLAEIVGVFSSGSLPEVPERVMARASQWLEQQEAKARASQPRPSFTRRVARHLEEIRAALVMDSAAGGVLVGVRAATQGRERQLLFESEAASVHVLVTSEASGSHLVLGQLLPADGEEEIQKGRALLEEMAAAVQAGERATGKAKPATGGKARMSTISPSGEFSFKGIVAPDIRLTLEWGERRMILDPIRLQEAGGES